MTKKMKMVMVLTHVAVLAVGFMVGVFSSFARYANEGMKMTSQGAMISHYASLVDVAKRHGDQNAYKKSLLAFSSVLDEIIKHPSEFFDAKTTSTDKVFVCERLSRIARETGNTKEADDYMNLAVQTCGQSGLKNCSIEKITMISKKLEENSMFQPKDKDSRIKH
jgi:hypothetical protein